MKKFVFAILISLIVSLLGGSIARAIEKTDKKNPASELLASANKAYKQKDYDRAFKLWRDIETGYKGTSEWCKALYNTGIALKEQKRFDGDVKRLESYDNLAAYLKRLGTLKELWRKVAKLTYDGKIEDARKLLRGDLPVLPSNKWHRVTQSLDKRLDPVRRQQDMTYRFEFPKVFLIMESPELGVKYLEAAQEERDLDFQWSIYFSQCLIETGQYSRARAILLGLIKEHTASDWKDIINSKVKVIEKLEDGEKPSTEFYRKIFLESSLRWYDGRLGPILSVWERGSDNQHLQILAALFAKAGDDYGEKLTLELIATRPSETGDQKDTSDALLQLANKAHKAKNYDQAFRLWRQIETDYKGTSAWGKAVYNFGIVLKEQKRFDEAIQQFKKLLAGDVNDTERGSHIMEAYRNYRPKAQWEIGDCLFAKGNYKGALQSYQAVEEKHPFRSWCGTCLWGYKYRYALYQGLCLEYLEKYNQAVKSYFRAVINGFSSNPTIHIRLADLYQGAGQTAVLEKILDETDAYLVKKVVKEHGTKIYDDPDFDEHLFTRAIRRVLEIRRLGENKDLTGLVELIKAKGTVAGPEEYRARLRHWEAIEAAKLLARYPKQAVPLLKSKMDGDADDKLIYYALGLCGTKEAVGILKSEAIKQKNINWAIPAVYALNLAGDAGKATLDELAKLAQGNLKIAIQRYKEGKLGDADKEIKFPRISKKIKLPERLAEIDDDVAYWQSLPQKVSVDLSKPELTIKTFITSMIIADKNAHSKCFADSNLAEKMNEDDCRSLRTVYEITGVKFSNDNTAEVDLNLSIGHKSHRIMFILKNINNQWLITGFKEGRRLKTGK